LGFINFLVCSFFAGPSTFDLNTQTGEFIITERYFVFIPFSKRYQIRDIIEFDFQNKMTFTKRDGTKVYLEKKSSSHQLIKRMDLMNSFNTMIGVSRINPSRQSYGAIGYRPLFPDPNNFQQQQQPQFNNNIINNDVNNILFPQSIPTQIPNTPEFFRNVFIQSPPSTNPHL